MSKNGQTSRQERSIDPGRSKHRFRLTCRYRCAGRRSRFAQIECKMSVNLVLVSCNIHASVMMVNKGWKADFPTTTLPRSHSGPAVGQRLKHLLHSRQNKHTVMTISTHFSVGGFFLKGFVESVVLLKKEQRSSFPLNLGTLGIPSCVTSTRHNSPIGFQ